MISRGADVITDTTNHGGAYGPVVNTRTHKIVLSGGYQPPNYTYKEFQSTQQFANYFKPKESPVTDCMFPWSRTQEPHRIISAVTASNALIFAQYMSTPPTASDGWWTGGVVSEYNLVGDGISYPIDEHHTFISIEAYDLALPAWVCSKPIAHYLPGYLGSGAQLVSAEEPTDTRAVAFQHRCAYTDSYAPFGGYGDRRSPLLPYLVRYNISLTDGAVYAPWLHTNGTSGETGPMWWGIPPARLQVYGMTFGNDGSGGGLPGSYTITLRGEDRDGNLTVLQTWTGSVPVVQYSATYDRSAIGLDITLTPSFTLPDNRFVNYKYYQSIYSGDVGHYARLHVPFTPALHPGSTSPAASGDFIPVGWMMKVRDAI